MQSSTRQKDYSVSGGFSSYTCVRLARICMRIINVGAMRGMKAPPDWCGVISNDFFTCSFFSSLQQLSKAAEHIDLVVTRPSPALGLGLNLTVSSPSSVMESEDLETLALIRRSSLEVALTDSNLHALHAVADHSRQENELEAAKWRLHFQDPKATRYEIRRLRDAKNAC